MLKQIQNKHLSFKQVITLTLLVMTFGTAIELFLLHHYEGLWQWVPLICIGAFLLVMLLLRYRRSNFMLNVFQVLLGLTALSGIGGAFLHLRANLEFEQEMKPTASAWDLFVESLSGALPTLAPASMIVLALIGYSYLLLLKQEQ